MELYMEEICRLNISTDERYRYQFLLVVKKKKLDKSLWKGYFFRLEVVRLGERLLESLLFYIILVGTGTGYRSLVTLIINALFKEYFVYLTIN